MSPEELKQRLRDTKFVVEATSCECQFLWEWWSEDALYRDSPHRRVSWEQLNPGWFETVGHCGDSPICVNVWWNRINGVLVMFWEATSELVDFKIVRAWIEKQCSPRWAGETRLAHTDANNFHHVLHAIEEMQAQPVATDRADLKIAADMCEEHGFALAAKLLRQASGATVTA